MGVDFQNWIFIKNGGIFFPASAVDLIG